MIIAQKINFLFVWAYKILVEAKCVQNHVIKLKKKDFITNSWR